GLLATAIPLITLAVNGHERVMFGGAFVVDHFALAFDGVFVVAGYLVVLLSTNYIAEGDYWEGEYYILVLSSVLGMMVMASARDLITIFVALELLSIPAYMLAAWRKRDLRSNEAGLKYYLMGVFASAIMLYGMSLIYGFTGTTVLAEIGHKVNSMEHSVPIVSMAIVFMIIGFAFKVSAVPFHTWAPDTYEGAPTPVAAFLATASKTAGFVALMELVFIGFLGRHDVYQPMIWVLSALSMTVGNLIALRQTNVVRMLAYSGIAQAGYVLAPLAVAGTGGTTTVTALRSMVIFLTIYVVMNLGAFAVVIAVARKTRSAELTSFSGLFTYAPGLAVCMAIFLASLAGIPPLGGWFAKFVVFNALVSAGTTAGYVLAVVVGVNSVIALYYYLRVARYMFMEEAPDDDRSPIRVPVSLTIALTLTVALTLVYGVFPSAVTHFTDTVHLAFGG
ncbi:MAG TPA: NADH-quinone oxidoreductase subunit N, partial [Acidimicrobiales bacterium]|nr:NADH-quinone oxidoreductase subunit N [Acidimicrobiales bacterium]